MIDLPPIIVRIKALLADDSEASVTYAALEARLALEKVCYDRLRQCHDYISHAQLKRWQPRQVMNTLISDVDPHATQTRTLHMSRNPTRPDVKPEDDDYVEIGTEVGFDPKRLERMWNALAKLALHVRLPQHREDHIPEYGDKAAIRAKVQEVVIELERLSKGTMTFSGIGPEVLFECICGEKNRRRALLLRDGQHVHCINPECDWTWKASKETDGFAFEPVHISVNCESCKEPILIPWRSATKMKPDQQGSFTCNSCGHKNYIKWRLMQVKRGME